MLENVYQLYSHDFVSSSVPQETSTSGETRASYCPIEGPDKNLLNDQMNTDLGQQMF